MQGIWEQLLYLLLGLHGGHHAKGIEHELKSKADHRETAELLHHITRGDRYKIVQVHSQLVPTCHDERAVYFLIMFWPTRIILCVSPVFISTALITHELAFNTEQLINYKATSIMAQGLLTWKQLPVGTCLASCTTPDTFPQDKAESISRRCHFSAEILSAISYFSLPINPYPWACTN